METYDLPITYKGKELSFPMRLGQFAHGYKLYITVDDTEVTVERDDQGDWRALISPEQLHAHKIEPGLISAIMESIQAVFEE